MISIHVKVKFRAFGVTFGQLEKTVQWAIPGAMGLIIPSFRDKIIDERGVFVEVYKV